MLALLVCGAAAAESTQTPRLGRPAGPDLVARWNLSVYPDGRGLPPGQGTAAQGRSIYRDRCAKCHGPEGEGGSGGTLVGRGPLTDPDPDQTVGNYWPYATTLFDFIRRAMPMDAPATLSDDEIYAVSAYLLYMNRIIGLDDRLDASSLPRVRMPNRDGFVGIDADLPGTRPAQTTDRPVYPPAPR
jgi:S-disulfanyl-L-cysteine oxidoreductase SoxD